MEDVAGAWVGDGEDDAFGHGGCGEVCCVEELVVAGGVVAALLIPPGEVSEFDLEDGGLDGVEAGVPADLVVIVAGDAMPWARRTRLVVVDCGGGGGDEAGVSHGAEIFCGVEAEGGGVAEGSGGDVVPGGSEGLGGVLDEYEVVVLLEGGEGVPVGALAVEMDGEDGFGRCCQRGSGGPSQRLGRRG